jgi:4-amino-4-deoxy-L-arabinose transferase-like glycosyltransferase
MDHGTASPRSAEAFALDAAPAAPMAGTHRQERLLWRYIPSWWPLLAVLAVQAGLSLRLVRADTAFQDEAAYLWAGHLEWAHWLHGAPVPPFSSYFSGSPAIYPPIAAMADAIGNLTASRILSLFFMLGATALLWGAADRLYGHRAAFFAAALFAALGPTLHLGAFATYDAMSVFLVALAAWCVIRAPDSGDATGRMVAAGVALALANATAYSSALFDPIVALLALLTAFPKPGGKTAARRIAILLVVVVTLLLIGLLIGGGSYLHGIRETTLERASGAASAPSVLADAWSWTGIVLILSVGGVVASVIGRQGRTRTWLLVLLTLAAILGPLEQANLHTAASLNKHVGLGAWFAAVAAGYAVDKFVMSAAAGRTRALTAVASVLALVFPLSLGISQSWAFSTSWANASSFIAIFRPLADQGTGRMLVEDPSIAEYYTPAGSQWQRWSSTRNIVLPSGASSGGPSQSAGVVGAGNPGTMGLYIEKHYFSLVALNNADTASLDLRIDADLRRWGYHVIQVVPYGIEVPPIGKGTYVIWRYEPPK